MPVARGAVSGAVSPELCPQCLRDPAGKGHVRLSLPQRAEVTTCMHLCWVGRTGTVAAAESAAHTCRCSSGGSRLGKRGWRRHAGLCRRRRHRTRRMPPACHSSRTRASAPYATGSASRRRSSRRQVTCSATSARTRRSPHTAAAPSLTSAPPSTTSAACSCPRNLCSSDMALSGQLCGGGDSCPRLFGGCPGVQHGTGWFQGQSLGLAVDLAESQVRRHESQVCADPRVVRAARCMYDLASHTRAPGRGAAVAHAVEPRRGEL